MSASAWSTRMRQRKANATAIQFWIVLVITLISAILFFAYIPHFKEASSNTAQHALCKNSNLANAKLKFKINNQVIEQRIGNKCVTEYVTAPKGKEVQMIADRMAKCWDVYLEGKEELFETSDNT